MISMPGSMPLVGIVFGMLGYATGAIWMSYTWADPNNPAFQSFSAIAREPKLIGAAIALLIYFAYMVLRDSINDMDKRARISSVYNIFAYAMLFPSIWIITKNITQPASRARKETLHWTVKILITGCGWYFILLLSAGPY